MKANREENVMKAELKKLAVVVLAAGALLISACTGIGNSKQGAALLSAARTTASATSVTSPAIAPNPTATPTTIVGGMTVPTGDGIIVRLQNGLENRVERAGRQLRQGFADDQDEPAESFRSHQGDGI